MNDNCRNTRQKPRFLAIASRLLLMLGLISLFPGGTLLAAEKTPAEAMQSMREITVYKTPRCDCCNKWVDHLEAAGFNVDVNIVSETSSVRSRLGVPPKLASCHTAVASNYWIEGHVPADLVHQLLHEQPAGIRGISAPGMPAGSPGMESANPAKYDVLSVNDSGEIAVYATRQGRAD